MPNNNNNHNHPSHRKGSLVREWEARERLNQLIKEKKESIRNIEEKIRKTKRKLLVQFSPVKRKKLKNLLKFLKSQKDVKETLKAVSEYYQKSKNKKQAIKAIKAIKQKIASFKKRRKRQVAGKKMRRFTNMIKFLETIVDIHNETYQKKQAIISKEERFLKAFGEEQRQLIKQERHKKQKEFEERAREYGQQRQRYPHSRRSKRFQRPARVWYLY